MGSGEEREAKKAKYHLFQETELRLGLPGGAGAGTSDVDLKLNLSSSSLDIQAEMDIAAAAAAKKMAGSQSGKEKATAPPAPASKAPVVGWPPVRSFRKNTLSVAHKNNASPVKEDTGDLQKLGAASYVKVSMDGAPYLRKVDLDMYNNYRDLCAALAKMFCSFAIGNYEPDGMKDFMNDTKLVDLLNGWEYVPTYEDKDGDWMLLGDVPWEMFKDSCKRMRMRIMKGKEAVGLGAPRAMEKCKSRI